MTSSLSRSLSPEEAASFAAELDALRKTVLADLGERDARYVRGIRDIVRWSEFGGRGLLFAGALPPAWLAGTLLLALSKILENMELGHNVMHGQYNWLHDPELRSQTYEWDNVSPAREWRHAHNHVHHTFTNVLGRDRDLGYGIFRLFPEQPWQPVHLVQVPLAMLLALGFEWGVALHHLELERALRGERSLADVWTVLKSVLGKARRQVLKDYVVWPLLGGPAFLFVLAGNLGANVLRNLWAFSVIFCGHFTENSETFPESALDDETRGEWYLRQLRGSSNLEGPPLFHILSGNLSHQIEHHLFSAMPAHRYAEVAVDVRRIASKYGQHYNTGSFPRQFATVMKRLVRYSLPADAPVLQRAVDAVNALVARLSPRARPA